MRVRMWEGGGGRWICVAASVCERTVPLFFLFFPFFWKLACSVTYLHVKYHISHSPSRPKPSSAKSGRCCYGGSLTRDVTLSSIPLSSKPAKSSVQPHHHSPLRSQSLLTSQILHLLLAVLISRIDSRLDTARFSDHDGRVGVVLLHCWVGAGEEGPVCIIVMSELCPSVTIRLVGFQMVNRTRIRRSRRTEWHCYARSFGNAGIATPSGSW